MHPVRGLPLLALLASTSLWAEPRYTQSDFGGVGLLQTPTARMSPAGELSFTASRTSPYSRYNVTLQPFDWFEGSFRYITLSNMDYGPEALSGDQSLKDKSIDFKLRLWSESRWLPQLAVGMRDAAGTGLFSSEYFVANKRFDQFDFSLGLAWGYIGNRADLDNPFKSLNKKFKDRPNSSSATGGEFNASNYFRGSPALFGGFSYQTPWQPLTLKLEYDGNDYKNEPRGTSQDQDSPINLGVVYALGRNVDLHLGWERGNTAMFGITLYTNFATSPATSKVLDPAPEPVRTQLPPEQIEAEAWADIAQRLRDNAGYQVNRISRRDNDLLVYGEQTRYFHDPKAIGRAARIVDNSAPADIDWVTLVDHRNGVPTVETSVPRDIFHEVIADRGDIQSLRRMTSQNAPVPHQEQVLFEQPMKRLSYGLGLGYKQSMGGPDAFLLYQVSLDADFRYQFSPRTWTAGTVRTKLLDNYDKFKYDGTSNMERVRTRVREYLTSADVTLPTFSLNHARQLGQDLYGMTYGGMLESMFAGVGAELLYRPMGERWAISGNLNWVRQRGFRQDFALRDYSTLTGHITGYLRADEIAEGLVLSPSVGRYLAGDLGVTFDVYREFKNGVRYGAWATFTNVSKQEFGEGSFDKGIYFSIPFDEILAMSTLRRANFVWQPLTRDGGARLARPYSLYNMTEGRNIDFFHDNFGKITE